MGGQTHAIGQCLPFSFFGRGVPFKNWTTTYKKWASWLPNENPLGTSWEAQQSPPALYASFCRGMPCVQELGVIFSGGSSLLNCYPIKWCSRKPPGKPFLEGWFGPPKGWFSVWLPLKTKQQEVPLKKAHHSRRCFQPFFSIILLFDLPFPSWVSAWSLPKHPQKMASHDPKSFGVVGPFLISG